MRAEIYAYDIALSWDDAPPSAKGLRFEDEPPRPCRVVGTAPLSPEQGWLGCTVAATTRPAEELAAQLYGATAVALVAEHADLAQLASLDLQPDSVVYVLRSSEEPAARSRFHGLAARAYLISYAPRDLSFAVAAALSVYGPNRTGYLFADREQLFRTPRRLVVAQAGDLPTAAAELDRQLALFETAAKPFELLVLTDEQTHLGEVHDAVTHLARHEGLSMWSWPVDRPPGSRLAIIALVEEPAIDAAPSA